MRHTKSCDGISRTDQNPYVFIAQMQLTRSKLKYIEQITEQMFGWTEWPLPLLAMLMHCGWRTIILTSSSVVGEPTTTHSVDSIVFCALSHFSARMPHDDDAADAIQVCPSKTSFVVHAGMPSTQKLIVLCFTFACVRLPCAFGSVVDETHSVFCVCATGESAYRRAIADTETEPNQYWALQNPTDTNIEHVILCFWLFLHTFFFLLHCCVCHWFALWMNSMTSNRTESRRLSVLLNDTKNMLLACVYGH